MAYFKDDLPRTDTFRLLLSCVPIGMMNVQRLSRTTTKIVPFCALDVSNWDYHMATASFNSSNNKDYSILCFGCI
jgi:hypothetical protein